MGDRILSHVLELTVISLDGMGDYKDDPPTIEKLAGYFGKTVPQLETIVRRLLEDGYIMAGSDRSPEARLSKRTVLYPTPASLARYPHSVHPVMTSCNGRSTACTCLPNARTADLPENPPRSSNGQKA